MLCLLLPSHVHPPPQPIPNTQLAKCHYSCLFFLPQDPSGRPSLHPGLTPLYGKGHHQLWGDRASPMRSHTGPPRLRSVSIPRQPEFISRKGRRGALPGPAQELSSLLPPPHSSECHHPLRLASPSHPAVCIFLNGSGESRGVRVKVRGGGTLAPNPNISLEGKGTSWSFSSPELDP